MNTENLSRSNQTPNILVVEDSESKWTEIESTIIDLMGLAVTIIKVGTIVDAENQIERSTWDLIILDISMDITVSTRGPKRGGHDALGGLRIANKMFLLGREAPTLVVTAFDAFPTGTARRGDAQILGLEDVEATAAQLLGSSYLGTIRYGVIGWSERFKSILQEHFKL